MGRSERRHGKRDATISWALSGGTLPNGTVARCGMSCGHVLTSEQKTNMREGKRREGRGAGRAVPPFCVVYMNTHGSRHFRHTNPYNGVIESEEAKRKAENGTQH